MVWNRHKKIDTELIATVIGSETRIKGTLHSQRSIRIEGNVEGEIHSQGDVFVGKNSQVKATIFASTLTVAGEVIGSIQTLKGLHVLATGQVYGNVTGEHLKVDEGGIYRGNVNMDVIQTHVPYEGDPELNPQKP